MGKSGAMKTTRTENPRVIHALPGRVRVHCPGWSGEDLAWVEQRLAQLPGVRAAQSHPLTRNVLIHFNPQVINDRRLLEALTPGGREPGFSGVDFFPGFPTHRGALPEPRPAGVPHTGLSRKVLDSRILRSHLWTTSSRTPRAARRFRREDRLPRTSFGQKVLRSGPAMVALISLAIHVPRVHNPLSSLFGQEVIAFVHHLANLFTNLWPGGTLSLGITALEVICRLLKGPA